MTNRTYYNHGEQNKFETWGTEQIRNMENRNIRNMSNKSWSMENRMKQKAEKMVHRKQNGIGTNEWSGYKHTDLKH